MGSEHLLLSLLQEGDCTAVGVLRTFGIDPRRLERNVLAKIQMDKSEALEDSRARMEVCVGDGAVPMHVDAEIVRGVFWVMIITPLPKQEHACVFMVRATGPSQCSVRISFGANFRLCFVLCVHCTLCISALLHCLVQCGPYYSYVLCILHMPVSVLYMYRRPAPKTLSLKSLRTFMPL